VSIAVSRCRNRCSSFQDERAKEVGHRDRRWSELGGDIHGDSTIESALPAGHRHGNRLRELVREPCRQVVGNHQIELACWPTEPVQDLTRDRWLRIEAHVSGGGFARMERGACGEDVGNDVDVGGRAARRSAGEVEVEGDHLPADQDPGIWPEAVGEIGDE